jgi:hypothetical protein
MRTTSEVFVSMTIATEAPARKEGGRVVYIRSSRNGRNGAKSRKNEIPHLPPGGFRNGLAPYIEKIGFVVSLLIAESFEQGCDDRHDGG